MSVVPYLEDLHNSSPDEVTPEPLSYNEESFSAGMKMIITKGCVRTWWQVPKLQCLGGGKFNGVVFTRLILIMMLLCTFGPFLPIRCRNVSVEEGYGYTK